MRPTSLRPAVFGVRRRRELKRQFRNRLSGIEGLETRLALSATVLDSLAESEGPVGVEARIVNGTVTTSFQSVGLVGDSRGNFCSGTLIAPSHVLTAGHCAEGVGNSLGRFTVGGQSYSTNQVHVHPQYNNNTLANDIAIYSLDRQVTNVAPSSINRTIPNVGQLLTLVGFGGGGTGTSGQNGDFGTKRVGTTPIDGVTATLITWTFDNNSESNTAPGDSGGPAFVNISGAYLVAGVTSGGDRADAGIGDHSFDTRVDAFASWVDSITGGPSNPPPPPDPGTDDHASVPGASATAMALSNSVGRGTGSLETVGDRDVFKVSILQSSTATITVTGANSLDTYVRVYNSSNQLVAENDDFGATLNSQLSLPTGAGVYYISVGSYADQTTGNFTVDVRLTTNNPDPFPNAQQIALSQSGLGSATGSIAHSGENDFYVVTAAVSGRMTFRTRASSSRLDTILTLYNAQGNELASNDDYQGSLDSRVLYDVVAGSKYYIKVSSYSGTTGGYRLNLSTQALRSLGSPRDLFDVNADGTQSPLDVLAIVNYLNSGGQARITSGAADSTSQFSYDVNGDGSVTPIDALLLVNRLNGTGESEASPASEPLPVVWFGDYDPFGDEEDWTILPLGYRT